MPFGLLKGNTPPIAVDFGVGSMKLLQVEPGDTPYLIGAACLATPDELIEKPAERIAYQSQMLPTLLKAGGFKGKRAVCSVSASLTFVQHLQVPKSDGVSIETAMAEQIRQTAGRDPAQHILRHLEVGEVTRSGAKKTEVICFAIPRDAVMTHMRALRAAKLEPVGVHTEHLAAVRSLDPVQRRNGDTELTTLMVDLGYGTTKVMVTHGRNPVLAKTIYIAGRDTDTQAARSTNCTPAEAHRRRLARLGLDDSLTRTTPGPMAGTPPKSGGFLSGLLGGRGAAQAQAQPEASGLAIADDRRTGAPTTGLTELSAGQNSAGADAAPSDPTVESIADEIAMCVRYHSALFPDRKLDRVIFFGGESMRKELPRHVARIVRLPALLADPLSALPRTGASRLEGLDLSRPAPAWAVPLGLCLSPTDL